MRRFPNSTLVVICIAFCVFGSLLWLFSWRRNSNGDPNGFVVWNGRSGSNVRSAYGRIMLRIPISLSSPVYSGSKRDIHWESRWAGIYYYKRLSRSTSYWEVHVYYRTLLLPSLLYLTIAFARHFANRTSASRRRLLHGVCTKCSYDLRASKDRCPECGTDIPHVNYRLKQPGPL